MSQAQFHHDRYWRREQAIDFYVYERNWFLPQLFDSPQTVLDIGCGDGAVGEYLTKNCDCTVIGIDFSPTALTRAQSRGVLPILGSIDQTFPVTSASVDTVFFGDVIEHIYHPDQAIKEITRVLKPGGRLIVSCPNMGYWRYRVHYLIHGMFPETEWIESDLWQSQHIRFFNQTMLYQLLNKYHLTPRRFFGISRRRLDQPGLKIAPALFGMIMMVESYKK